MIEQKNIALKANSCPIFLVSKALKEALFGDFFEWPVLLSSLSYSSDRSKQLFTVLPEQNRTEQVNQSSVSRTEQNQTEPKM